MNRKIVKILAMIIAGAFLLTSMGVLGYSILGGW